MESEVVAMSRKGEIDEALILLMEANIQQAQQVYPTPLPSYIYPIDLSLSVHLPLPLSGGPRGKAGGRNTDEADQESQRGERAKTTWYLYAHIYIEI
jgi:hypothetical protein